MEVEIEGRKDGEKGRNKDRTGGRNKEMMKKKRGRKEAKRMIEGRKDEWRKGRMEVFDEEWGGGEGKI